MIKFYTGIEFKNQGDGIYFITPATGVAHIYTVVDGNATKVAEKNDITASEVNAIKTELQNQITANANSLTTVIAGLKAITDKHGATLETLEGKVTQNTTDIQANEDAIAKVVSGETPVAKAVNADNATKASQDAEGNVITSTYATKQELNAHKEYVGTFTGYTNEQGKEIDTIVEYIDDKTTGIASDSAVQSLGNRVSTVEGYFDNDGNAKNALDANHADAADVATTAEKTQGTLTVGEKTFNGSANVTVSAADLGLDNAIHFLGTSSTAITDGGSEVPTIEGWSGSVVAGDIVLYGNQEYIWSAANKWEVFGNEGSYAIKTQKIEAGEGLTGGGDLSADREIAHAVPTGAGVANNKTATAGTFISGLTFDKFGHVVSVETAAETDYDADKGIEITEDGVIQHTNSVTAGTVKGNSGDIAFGGAINIPSITYDAQGHITGTTTTTVNLPSDDRIVAIENTLVWRSTETGEAL